MEVVKSCALFLAFAVFLLALSPSVALPTLVSIPAHDLHRPALGAPLRTDTGSQREEWDRMVGLPEPAHRRSGDIRAFGQEEHVLATCAPGRPLQHVPHRLSRKRLWLSSYLSFTCSSRSDAHLFGACRLSSTASARQRFFFTWPPAMMPMSGGCSAPRR